MAPITRVKTYSKAKKAEISVVQRDYNLWDVSANNSNLFPVTGASRAVDSLLAKNVEKRDASFKEEKKKTRAGSRKSKRLEIAGTRTKYKVSPRFLDVSIDLRINSTFDNLLQGPKYRSVQVCNISSLCGDNSVENSNSYFKKIALSPIQNPKLHKIENNVKTRRTRKKKNEVITNGRIVKKNTGKKLSKIIKNIPNINTANHNNITTSNSVPKKLYNYLDESINHSLIIERVKPPQHNMIRKSISDNSSYNCARKFTPIVATSKANGLNQQHSVENISFQFPLSFRRCMQAQNSPKYNLLSSTPLVPRNVKRPEELAQWSPITAKCSSRLKFSQSNNSLPTNKSANNKKHANSVIVIDSVLSENESLQTKNTHTRRKRRRSNNKSRQQKDVKLDYTPVVKLDKSLDILGISGNLSLASLKPTSKKNKIINYSPSVHLNQPSISSSLAAMETDDKQNYSPTVNLTRYSFSTFRKKPARTSSYKKRSKIRKIPNVLLEKLSVSSFLKNPRKYVLKNVINSNNNKTDDKSAPTKGKVTIKKNTSGRKLNNKVSSRPQDENKKSKKKVPKKKNKMILKKGKRKAIISDSEWSMCSPSIHSKKSSTRKSNSSNKSYNCSLSLFDDQPAPIRAPNRRIIRSKAISKSPNEENVQILNNKGKRIPKAVDKIEIIDLTNTLDSIMADTFIGKKRLRGRASSIIEPNKSTVTASRTVQQQTTSINNKPKLRITRSSSVSVENHNGSRDISTDLQKSIVSSKTNNAFNNNLAHDSEVFKASNPIRNTSNGLRNNSFDDGDKSPNNTRPRLRTTRSCSVSFVNDSIIIDKSIVSDTFNKSFNNSTNDSEVFKVPKPIRNTFNGCKKNSPNNIKPRLSTTRSCSASFVDCNDSIIIDKTILLPTNTSNSFNKSEIFKVPKPIRNTLNGFKNNSFVDGDKSPNNIRPRLRTTRSCSVSFIDSNDSKTDKSIVSDTTSKSFDNSINDSDKFKVPKSIRQTLNGCKDNSFEVDKSPLNNMKPRLRNTRSSSVSILDVNKSREVPITCKNNSSSIFMNGKEVGIKPRLRITRSASVSLANHEDSNNKNEIKNNLSTFKNGKDVVIKPGLRITRSASVSLANYNDSNNKNEERISVSDVLKSISFDANKTSSNTSEEFVDFEDVVKEFVIEKSLDSEALWRQDDDFVSKRKSNVQFDVNKSTKRQPSVSLDTWENFCQRRTEVSTCTLNTSKSITENGRKTLILKPGKQWFRSLSILRHTTVFDDGANDILTTESVTKGRKWTLSVAAVIERQNQSVLNASNNPEEISNHISRSGFVENRRTTLQIIKARSGYSRSLGVNGTDNALGYVSTLADESILESLDKLSLTTDVEEREETARQIVLRRCGQTLPVLFDECYSQRILTRCRKIGEGVYGEVFMYKSLEGQCRVMKVIPLEGDMLVNGEQQKKFEEIISEIVIASELSNLRTNAEFCTDGFSELLKICCVKGKYPQHLQDLWELYDEDHGSENDSPQIFTDDQLYIVLELANGGQDLEAFRFKNAEQSYAVFIQVVCSLAVAEAALEFEHRDMHWGNILICPTDEPTSAFRLNGREFEVATRGVKVSIIDFTLSRMTFNNCCIFNDLALDADLFSATGDYQFDIYRLMQQRNQNEWQHFEPHSNVLWLDYTLEKMITHLRYVRVNSKTHKNSIRRLSQLKKNILNFNSATQFLNSDVFSHVFL